VAAVQIEHDHYRVLIERRAFADDDWTRSMWTTRFGDRDHVWIDVPTDKVVPRPDNPLLHAILCYSVMLDKVYCFVPWDFGG